MYVDKKFIYIIIKYIIYNKQIKINNFIKLKENKFNKKFEMFIKL